MLDYSAAEDVLLLNSDGVARSISCFCMNSQTYLASARVARFTFHIHRQVIFVRALVSGLKKFREKVFRSHGTLTRLICK